MSLISLKNITKTYGSKNTKLVALKNINLEITDGEMIAIMGTSGSGKTTLLNILGCLDSPTSGEYSLNNIPITNYTNNNLSKFRNKHIGFILQDFALIEKYTVFKNICIPLEYSEQKYNKYIKKTLISDILSKVNLNEKSNILVSDLSGGQKQRVAIARAIINNPSIILADEPTGSLDSKNSIDILNILKSLNSEGTTIILVTHDINIASHCSKILFIEDGLIVNPND